MHRPDSYFLGFCAVIFAAVRGFFSFFCLPSGATLAEPGSPVTGAVAGEGMWGFDDPDLLPIEGPAGSALLSADCWVSAKRVRGESMYM